MRNKRLQGRVTAGRWTLPAVILTCTFCWILAFFLLPDLQVKGDRSALWQAIGSSSLPEWGSRMLSFLSYALIGYLLIQLNNTFAIIRMRASVQTSVYFLLMTICIGLHPLYSGTVVAVCFLLSIYFLFNSYQKLQSSSDLFYSFLFLGTGSLLFPQLTFFSPLWLLEAYRFRSLTFRSFWGAVLGWTVPYWFLFGHAFFYGEMQLFYHPFQELMIFSPFLQLSSMPLWEIVTLAFLFILYVVSSVHCIIAGYEDKIQTRSYLQFLIDTAFFIFIFILWQPALGMELLPLLIIIVSILVGHLFVLTHSKASNFFFIGTMSVLILLFVFNIWTLL